MPPPVNTLSLRDLIGQMLLVGFRGCELDLGSPIIEDIRQRNLGGVILFDQEMVDTSLKERNIRSPEQVRELTALLQARAKTPLLIAVDQEGGRVNRLKPGFGFPQTLSHEELGKTNDPTQTFAHAELIAQTLADVGINLNLAPVVDLDANPDNLIIKGKKRSFSGEPSVVAIHAAEFVRAHQRQGVITCLKHFPGHGSARGDTHHGLVDVTETWTERELLPFKHLIDTGLCRLIMSAHVFNAKLDGEHPATLSRKILNDLLRTQFGYRGVITSDDMEMKAISSHYGLEKAIELAVNAGVDILCFGNNMNYDPGITEKAMAILVRLVETGCVPESRIRESAARVLQLKLDAGLIHRS